ncbi:DNA (cytosine-5-)-methyltransferase N-terminal subunit [Ureaplasma diversum]|nr:DNA methyltransferase [Ureaplasma diversum]
MKKVRLFEMFAGIGSQYAALKNVYKDSGIEVVSLGSCDFYIDAIISYMIIHYGVLKPEENLSKEQMVELLNQYQFSTNSKDVVKATYFKSLKEDKLRSMFSYLYSYVNNDYFKLRYRSIFEREREREQFIRI